MGVRPRYVGVPSLCGSIDSLLSLLGSSLLSSASLGGFMLSVLGFLLSLSYFLRVTARGRVHGTRCRRSRPVTGSRSRIRYTANLKGARNCLRNGEPKIRLLPNDPSSDRCVRADERVR